MMLDGRSDNVLAFVARGQSDTLDGQVVALGATAGKYDFGGPAVENGGDLFTRPVNGLHGSPPKGVDTAGIAIVAGKIGQHGLQHPRIKGGRGRMVKINESLWHGYALNIKLLLLSTSSSTTV